MECLRLGCAQGAARPGLRDPGCRWQGQPWGGHRLRRKQGLRWRPGQATNLAEIRAGAQPGWTPGRTTTSGRAPGPRPRTRRRRRISGRLIPAARSRCRFGSAPPPPVRLQAESAWPAPMSSWSGPASRFRPPSMPPNRARPSSSSRVSTAKSAMPTAPMRWRSARATSAWWASASPWT